MENKSISTKAFMNKTIAVTIVAAVLSMLGVAALQVAWGQATTVATTEVPATTTTTNIIDSSANLIAVIAGLIGAIGAILAMLVPYISKISKEAGKKVEVVADSMIETDHYATDLSTDIKKNKTQIDIAKSVIEELALRDPELKVKWEDLQRQAIEKEKIIAEEAKKDTEQLKSLHDAVKKTIEN